MASRPYTRHQNDWLITGKEGGTYSGSLDLRWEVNGAAMSDDYTPADISARELLIRWARRYSHDRRAEDMYGPGMVSIYWGVEMPQNSERAPFYADCATREDFLTFFEWPISRATGERVNWNRVPVLDMAWSWRRSDIGGFFQEATGWKPSPMQPVVYLPGVLAAAGIEGVLEYHPREWPS